MRKIPSTTARVAAAALALTVAATAVPAIPGLSGLPGLSALTTQAAAAEKTIYTLNTKPFKQSGQLYLPLREVAPLLDLQLTYNSSAKSYQLTGITQTAQFKAGSAKATSQSGAVLSLGASVLVKNGVTYVPASLFSKLFSIPITSSGEQNISFSFTSRYLLSSSGDMLFWLNRSQNTLYGGRAGTLPSRLGAINLRSPDWLYMDAASIDKDTYVLEISNAHGEPHIFNDRIRVLIHGGKQVYQAGYSYGGPSMVNLLPDALSHKGQIIMNYGQYADLVSPDGTVQETIRFENYGTADEVYSLEAIEDDFFLIREYTLGTLLLVDRSSGAAVPLYLSLHSEESIDMIEHSEWGVGDGLTYMGRTGNQLKFSAKSPYSSADPTVKFYMLP
ncbi:stalk domain-containing protein [Paenibacillus brevis]|uniref:Copper amine oxidase N-terminal domain-containing protein n=1 Tax=Paenibacillus brevis TaxID=2841508 RepID=A0ABS6FYS5_9BACL|nr:stalk domain-containing protein [Paenibacillus brevis]MBU5674280.1 copper amine oxidase N-terminal domain-containing protein [Paenibacillus brevis]